ncbi:HEAT repeat domain-containing protein [bacterium]|nr:HEAT repeat domain-containing protein [bacterium]
MKKSTIKKKPKVGTEAIADLEAPLKTLRIMALEKILTDGGDHSLLEFLFKREKVEDDEECKSLLNYAIESIKKNLAPEEALLYELLDSPKEPINSQAFFEKFSQAGPGERQVLLDSLEDKEIKEYSTNAHLMLELEKNPFVAATIIRKFIEFWPKEHIKAVSSRLYSKSFSIRWAAMESLIKIAPQQLEKALPKLLQSSDPRTRILAVRGLSKIDLPEALVHLEALLISSDINLKMLAIRNSFYFAFSDIKPILLKFISAESDLSLVENACTLFETNPDVESPFKLWELGETAPAAKSQILKDSLKNALSGIEASKCLGDKFPLYQQKLKTWIQKRLARAFVQETILRLSSGDSQIEAEAEITAKMKIPLIKETMQEALSWVIPDEVKRKIEGFLGGRILPQGQAAYQTEQKPWDNLSPEEKIRCISSWAPSDQTSDGSFLEKIINSEESPSDVLATAFRSAAKFNLPNFQKKAWTSLKQSDPNIVSAALEYLSGSAPDELFQHIGKFLQSPNGRIKSTAIRILKRFDCAQSISSLKAMLTSRSVEQQKLALGCMVYFDVSLIRDILTEFMLHCQNSALLDVGITLFQANPEPENLFSLFKLQKKGNQEVSRLSQKAFQENLDFLAKSERLAPNEIPGFIKKIEEQWNSQEEKQKKPLPPYALKALPKKSIWDSPFGEKILGIFETWGLKIIIFLGLGGALIIMIFLGSSYLSSTGTQNDGSITRKSYRLEGVLLESIDSGARLVVRSKEEKTYEVIVKGQPLDGLHAGDPVKLTVSEHKVKDNGTIVCYFQPNEK